MKTLNRVFWWCLVLGVVSGVAGIALPTASFVSWKTGLFIELAAFVLSLTALAAGSEYNKRIQVELWNSKYGGCKWFEKLD